MTALFLAVLALNLALRLWLSWRQERHVRAHREEVPGPFRGHLPLDAHRKAADYTVARLRAGRAELAVRTLLLLAWTLGGGIDLLDRALDGVPFVLAALGLSALALLPFDIYRTFGIEERFGFNRTTPRLFVTDLLKEALLALLLGAPLCALALWLMRAGGDRWWLLVWVLWIGFSLFFTWAWPVLLAPLFHHFTPLPEGELKTRLQGLLERLRLPARSLFVMDGSRRSGHANAFFAGLGKRRRVVLFDTLCELLTPGEAEAVLAHEIGHARLHHVWTRLLAGAVAALGGLALLAAVKEQPWFYEGLGVSAPSDHAALLLFLWVFPLVAFPLRPLLSAWSRRQEYEADAFAARHSDGDALARALVKLYEKNASTLTPDPLFSIWYDSHPPAQLRIARLTRNPLK